MEKEIEEFIVCNYDSCNKYLEQPVCIPCGNTICQEHVTNHITNSIEKNYFRCKLCNEEHVVPKNGFALNKAALKVLNLNIHLKGKHKVVKKELEQLESLISENDKRSTTDADNFIFSYFSNIRNSLELHKESLFKRINDISDGIIKKLDSYEQECKQNSVKVNKINCDVIKNDELQKLKDELRFPNINIKNLDDILVKIVKNTFIIETQMSDYNKSLLMNKEYEFKPIELEENLFGDIFVREKEAESAEIINAEQKSQIKSDQNNNISATIDKYKIIRKEKRPMCLRGHEGSVSFMLVLKEFNQLISGSFDKTIKIWSIETGECLKTLNGHSSVISDLIYVPYKRLISSSWDNTLILWDIDKNYSPITKASYPLNICSMCLIDNGSFVCGFLDGKLRLMNINFESKSENNVHNGKIYKIKLISKLTLLTCSRDHTIKIIDIQTLNILQTLTSHNHSVICLEISADNHFLSGSADGKIIKWKLTNDFKNAEYIQEIPIFGKINDMKFIGSNKLAVASYSSSDIIFLDYEEQLILNEMNIYSGHVNKLQYCSELKLLFSSSNDFRIKMWKI